MKSEVQGENETSAWKYTLWGKKIDKTEIICYKHGTQME